MNVAMYISMYRRYCLCCNRDFRSVPINMKVSCLCYNRDFLAGLYHDSHNSHYSIANDDDVKIGCFITLL